MKKKDEQSAKGGAAPAADVIPVTVWEGAMISVEGIEIPERARKFAAVVGG